MGSKTQRQNQHQRRLKSKIKRFEKRGWSTEGLQKELSFSTGEAERPEYKTGAAANPPKRRGFTK